MVSRRVKGQREMGNAVPTYPFSDFFLKGNDSNNHFLSRGNLSAQLLSYVYVLNNKLFLVFDFVMFTNHFWCIGMKLSFFYAFRNRKRKRNSDHEIDLHGNEHLLSNSKNRVFSLLAQLEEHCSYIAEVIGSNPVWA